MEFIAATARVGRGLSRRLLDLLFPPQCIVCRSPGRWLCASCISQLPRIQEPVCRRCGLPISEDTLCSRCRSKPPRLAGIRAVFLHTGPLRVAVHRLKYRNARALAQPLGALMADWWKENPLDTDLVVPVPLHPSRLEQRGYNQAELLGRELGHAIGLPVDGQALSRTRATASQMKLDARDRYNNVRGAFLCSEGRASGKKVLLIDDVCTTGATLEACADALRDGQARDVWALTLARAL